VKRSLTLLELLISTIRTISLLVLGARANRLATAPSPSAMLLFVTSLIPYVSNELLPAWMRIVVAIDYIISFSVMTSIIRDPGFITNDYGELLITGGNCPVIQNATCSDLNALGNRMGSFVGCFPNMTHQAEPLTDQIHYVNVTEFLFGVLGMIFTVIVLVVYGGTMLTLAVTKGASRTSKWAKMAYAEKQADRKKSALSFWVSFALLTFIIAVAVSITIVPEYAVAQSHPATYSVYDGFGSPQVVSARNFSGDATSWTDCFDLRPPADKTGFFSAWWELKRARIARVLAGM
jgi:hypothetical protein